MTWSFNTGCRYHTQDTGYYCGAACAMMVLAEIGVPYTQLDQDDLYTSNNSHNAKSGWYTDPIGLCFTLNDRRPATFTGHFVVYKYPTTEAEGTRKIVDTLRIFRVSPSVLVYHCQHWIVVRGIQTDVDPSTGPYVLDGLWINNPVHNPPPTHNATDTCGSGGAWGVENEFVTYSYWQSNYFTGCNYDDPSGNNQFISVCDPNTPTVALPLRRPKTFYSKNLTFLIPKTDALEASAAGIERYGLLKSEIAVPFLKGGNAVEPLLVQRLDRIDEYYYLTPWQINRTTTAFVQIDARTGSFNSLRLLEAPKEVTSDSRIREITARVEGGISKAMAVSEAAEIATPWMISRTDAIKRLDYLRVEYPHEGRVVLHPEAYDLSRILYWQPCQESWSPNLPFYLVTVGNRRLYMRIDGEIFTKLTTNVKGA